MTKDYLEKLIDEYNKIGITETRLGVLLMRVSVFTGVPIHIMRSRSRKREHVEARHIFMALGKELYPKASNAQVASIINKNHASCNHARKTTSEIPSLRKEYEEIKNKITEYEID